MLTRIRRCFLRLVYEGCIQSILGDAENWCDGNPHSEKK
jgi:hypothetical protein